MKTLERFLLWYWTKLTYKFDFAACGASIILFLILTWVAPMGIYGLVAGAIIFLILAAALIFYGFVFFTTSVVFGYRAVRYYVARMQNRRS